MKWDHKDRARFGVRESGERERETETSDRY